MKSSRIASTAIVLAFSAGTALAAGLPARKGPVYVPSLPPPLWTGFYAGVNAGYTFSGGDNINTTGSDVYDAPKNASFFGFASAASATSNIVLDNNGFIGSGQIGYNWLFNLNWVASIETDIQGTTVSGNGSASGAAAETVTRAQVLTTTMASKSLDYLGTVRARVGYLVTPTLLIYGTGGLAYGGINLNTSVGQFATTPAFAPGFGGASASSTRAGWTAGGGLEWMFLPNWSAKLEYLYYDLGGVNASIPLGGGNQIVAGNPLLYSSALLTTANFNGHIVRVGLNYHFNWGAPTPVVAKY